MKLPDGIGLVCAGSVNQSFLSRMPTLLERLGPIKASSFRVSRQISNTLRAGYGASHYSELEVCPMIWIHVAEAHLDRLLHELVVRTPLRKSPFTRTMIVLCGCSRDSLAPSVLQATGARVATLNPIPDSHEKIFVAEGHADAVRGIRSVLEPDRRKLIRLQPATKPLFFGGIHMGAPLLLPWIAAGMECLRAAGFTRPEAVLVGEILGNRALRKYARAGQKAWSTETAVGLRRVLDHDLACIRALHPRLADLYEQGIRLALARFSKTKGAAAS